MTIALDVSHFEYVLNIANVVILGVGIFLCYVVLEASKKNTTEKEVYTLLFFVMFMLLAGQLLNVLQRFRVLVVPGGSAITYLMASTVLLYKLLVRQQRWKVQ